MGDPYHLKRSELKKHRVAVFSSNYTLYGDMSRRVMQTLSAFTPELEIYSIDEAFLNLAGFEHRDLADYARMIRAEGTPARMPTNGQSLEAPFLQLELELPPNPA
jgi:DNA polymerase V